MSMHTAGYDDLSLQASENVLVFQTGIHDAASLESQQIPIHRSYQPPPLPSDAAHGYMYTDSSFFLPPTSVDEYAGQYFDTQPKPHEFNTSTYSNPTNFAYVPGMPVQSKHFENMDFNNARGFSPGSSTENQWQPNHEWIDRERNYYPAYRGRGKNKYRGRGYKNMQEQSYSSYGQNGYYERDDYYYETPHYQYYNPPTGRRGGSADSGWRGRGGNYPGINYQSRLDDGDGKHHRKKTYGFQSDQNDVMDNESTMTSTYKHSNNEHGLRDKFSKTQMKNDFYSQGHHTHSKGLEKRYNFSQKFEESRKDIVTDVEEAYSEKSSRSNGYLGNESKKKEINAGSGRDQASYNRERNGTSNGARKGSGSASRVINTKRYRTGTQEPESTENDESQRATLTEQLSSSKYECMVCCDNIRPESAVWSCQNCYHVFHLSCIHKWAQSSLCKDTKSWRCPGCQNVSNNVPSQYRCFCGRRKDPVYKRGEIAHSCGETCRKKRKGGCKHPCTILCHPGPCPTCCAMVWVTCDCGKIRKHVRCSAVTSFKCDNICDKKLNCSDHKCQDTCHAGSCSPCSVSKMQECFCKKLTRKAICGTEEFMVTSFSCEKPCGRTLTCGNHVCEELCHPGECASCPLMPGNLHTCCCGKTPLSLLEVQQRYSCLDAVPTCDQICNKPMPCGSSTDPHLCERKCHEGDCGPCSKETSLKCLCGAIEKKMACEVAVTYNEQNPFKCQRRCGKKKTCGRHKCFDTCCVKDIHICEIVCGQKLSCGIHKCEELCHRGNCKRCLQASFEEVTCYCGAEVLEPPVPCGTRPPECRRLCTREHNCDHTVRHICHTEEMCPPCTDLTDKMCMGGHMLRKNVPCHLTNISCGYPCNKPLPCGEHKCQKICHKDECLENKSVCSQLCEKIRPACGHPCGAPCHSGQCPNVACKAEITITCPCGNRTAKALCSIGGDLTLELAQFQRLNLQSMAETGGQSMDLSQFAQNKRSNKRLDCDTNCAIIERNRRLALVLEIKNPDITAKLGNPTFTEFLKDYAKKNPKFAIGVEKSFTDLVQSAKQSAQPNRSYAFQSMNRDQRRFVHELAEFYGCQTQSYDYEPVKNVVATAVKDKCWLPNITLSQHVSKDQFPKLPPPISSFKAQGVTFTVLEKKKASTSKDQPSSSSRAWEEEGATATASKQEPAVDYFDFTSL